LFLEFATDLLGVQSNNEYIQQEGSVIEELQARSEGNKKLIQD